MSMRRTGQRFARIPDALLLDMVDLGEEMEANHGLRPKIKESFAYWCRHALAARGLAPAEHHLMLIEFLYDMAMGKFDRGMVFMPPGHAKTEYVSILFPAWFLSVFPSASVIGASNTAELAERNGRKVRNLVTEHQDVLNYTLSADSKAAGRWETSRGGEYFAVGIEGTAIGRRADLFVIDDPFRSRDQVETQQNRDKVDDWYKATVVGRMKPGGRIMIMHTRWHLDDLAGRRLEEMKAGGEQWRILNLPAIAGVDDPMGRQPGQALWPEWEDEKALERKRISVGSREWSSQYQQDPVPPEGALFMTNNLVMVDQLPAAVDWVIRAWDLAATEQMGSTDPDWTVGMKIAALANGQFAILNVIRVRENPSGVEDLILRTAKLDGDEVHISLPQDPAQAGKFQASYLVGKLAGYTVKATLMSGSKTTRAGPVMSQVEVGNLLVMKRTWTADLVSELKSFPSGSKDDQVDALSLGFMDLVELLGSDGILKYYEQMANSAKQLEIAKPATGTTSDGEMDAVAIYNEAFDRLRPNTEIACYRCGKPVGSSRVEDGVNVWHPECF